MTTPELLTVAEVAERLRLGRATVYRLVSSGALKTVRIGRARRVAVHDLREFVERLRQAAEQEEAGDERA